MSHFKLTSLFPILQIDGPDLLLRDYGKRAFPFLEQALRTVPDGRSLWVINDGVRVMDTSFCDETIIELMAKLIEGKYGDRYLILLDPSAATIDNLEGTIARRQSKLVVLVGIDDGVRPVGHLEPNLQDTWHRVQIHGTLTARELADALDLEISTASMRLRKLYMLHLLSREEQMNEEGRQHLYRIPS